MSQLAAAASDAAHHCPRRSDDSWVEISSQPSSSSLSSIGDEIITTGLRLGPLHAGNGRRNRRRRCASTGLQPPALSSQDEYDESESEEGGLLSSSAEISHPSGDDLGDALADASNDDSDDGDDATALGRAPDRPVFQPRPNAFSQPSGRSQARARVADRSGRLLDSVNQPSRASLPCDVGHRAVPYTSREDNEAALRTSLTTLLSCAAAARSLPKSRNEAEGRPLGGNAVGPSNQPLALRLVPEADLMQECNASGPTWMPLPGARPWRPVALPEADDRARSQARRAHSAARSPRATKKKKTTAATATATTTTTTTTTTATRTAADAEEEALISPTLLTWVVSAGVVVLVSIVGFGAGYVIGREVGRQEALSSSLDYANETVACGREVMRAPSGSLRRFRWGEMGKRIVAQA